MVTISPEAVDFIKELLKKENKTGYGIKIYLTGYEWTGPQFGISLQEKATEEDIEDDSAIEFKMFYDVATKKELDECCIEYIDDPDFGNGLTIYDPNFGSCDEFGDSYRSLIKYDNKKVQSASPAKTEGIKAEKSTAEEKPIEKKKELVADNNKEKLNNSKNKLKGLFKSKK